MATSFNFSDWIVFLEETGVYDVLLPFLLIFAISYGILQKVNIFSSTQSTGTKNLNIVVALVFAFLVVRNANLVEIMNTFLPDVSILALAILVGLLLIGIFVKKPEDGILPTGGAGFMVLLVIFGIVMVYLNAAGIAFPDWLSPDSDDLYIYVSILVVILLVLFVVASGGQQPTESKVLNALRAIGGDNRRG